MCMLPSDLMYVCYCVLLGWPSPTWSCVQWHLQSTPSQEVIACCDQANYYKVYVATVQGCWWWLMTTLCRCLTNEPVYTCVQSTTLVTVTCTYPARVCAGGVKRVLQSVLLSVRLSVCLSVCLSVTNQRCRDIWTVKQLLYLTETHRVSWFESGSVLHLLSSVI